MKYSRALDGLRGVAILLVILFHFGYLGSGWIGVQIFFVLSGYLITFILLADKHEPAGRYFGGFYWRRALRIFPIYYAYLAVLGLIFAVTALPVEFGERWAYLVTYTYNYALLLVPLRQSVSFTHFWSLAVEEQFYLLWPVIVYFSSRVTLRTIVIGVLVAAPIIRWLAVSYAQSAFPDHPQIGLFAYSPLPAQCDALATGAAVALWSDAPIRRPGVLLSVASVMIAALGVWNLTAGHPGWLRVAEWGTISELGFPPFATDRLQHVWSYSAINVWTAAVIVNVVANAGPARMLTGKFLVFAGRISYGLYVFHYPILGLIKMAVYFHPVSFRGIVIFPVYVATVFAVAYVSFTFFESWFLKWKHALFARRAGAA
jgi:peptidoglycan/LPS O-acetylase OafA/YrhL